MRATQTQIRFPAREAEQLASREGPSRGHLSVIALGLIEAFAYGWNVALVFGPLYNFIAKNFRLSARTRKDEVMTEVRSLHGTTVAEIFSAGLENLEQIEAVAVSVLWKDGTVTAGCSNTMKANLALMVLAMDEHQRRALVDGS